MSTLTALACVAYLLYLLYENRRARTDRQALQHVIHVNGIRGKSSVSRLIDAGCVAQLEPKPGCAVREVLDVPGAAELIDDRPGWPRSARWVLWHGWTSIAGRPR